VATVAISDNNLLYDGNALRSDYVTGLS